MAKWYPFNLDDVHTCSVDCVVEFKGEKGIERYRKLEAYEEALWEETHRRPYDVIAEQMPHVEKHDFNGHFGPKFFFTYEIQYAEEARLEVVEFLNKVMDVKLTPDGYEIVRDKKTT